MDILYLIISNIIDIYGATELCECGTLGPQRDFLFFFFFFLYYYLLYLLFSGIDVWHDRVPCQVSPFAVKFGFLLDLDPDLNLDLESESTRRSAVQGREEEGRAAKIHVQYCETMTITST